MTTPTAAAPIPSVAAPSATVPATPAAVMAVPNELAASAAPPSDAVVPPTIAPRLPPTAAPRPAAPPVPALTAACCTVDRLFRIGFSTMSVNCCASDPNACVMLPEANACVSSPGNRSSACDNPLSISSLSDAVASRASPSAFVACGITFLPSVENSGIVTVDNVSPVVV